MQMYFLCEKQHKIYRDEETKTRWESTASGSSLKRDRKYARRGWERRIWGRPWLHRGGSGMGPLKEPLMNEAEWFLGTKVGLSRVKEVLGHRHLVICFISPLSCTASTLHRLFSFSRSRSSFLSPDILSLARFLSIHIFPLSLTFRWEKQQSHTVKREHLSCVI